MSTWEAVLAPREAAGQLTRADFAQALRVDVGIGLDDLSEDELAGLWELVSSPGSVAPAASVASRLEKHAGALHRWATWPTDGEQNSRVDQPAGRLVGRGAKSTHDVGQTLSFTSPGPVGLVLVALDTGGCQVQEILPNTPAAAAGLLPGQRLLSVNGQPVETMSFDAVSTRIKERPVRLSFESPASRPLEEGVPRRGMTPPIITRSHDSGAKNTVGRDFATSTAHQEQIVSAELVGKNKALSALLQAARLREEACHQVLSKREGELAMATDTVATLRSEHAAQKRAIERDNQRMISQAARKIAMLTRQCQRYRTELDDLSAQRDQEAPAPAPALATAGVNAMNRLRGLAPAEGSLGLVRSNSYPNPTLDHRDLSPLSVHHLTIERENVHLDRRLQQARKLLARTPASLATLHKQQALRAWKQTLSNESVLRRLKQAQQQVTETVAAVRTQSAGQIETAHQAAAVAKQQASAAQELLAAVQIQRVEEVEAARKAAAVAEQQAASAQERTVAVEKIIEIERTQSAEELETVRKAASVAEQQAVKLRTKSAQRVIRRMRQASEAAAFGRWSDFVVETQRHRAVVTRLKARLTTSILQGFFKCWSSNCKSNQRIKAILLRVLARVQHALEGSVFQKWVGVAVESKRSRAVVTRLIRRMQRALEASALQRWVEFAAETQRNRAVVARLRARLSISIMRHSFVGWVDNSMEAQRNSAVVARLRGRLTLSIMQHSFEGWFNNIKSKQRAIALVLRALARWRREYLTTSWIRWVNFGHASATVKQVLARLRLNHIRGAFANWNQEALQVRFYAMSIARCRAGAELRDRIAVFRAWAGALHRDRWLGRGLMRLAMARAREGYVAGMCNWLEYTTNRRRARRVIQHMLNARLSRTLNVWADRVRVSKREIHDAAMLAVMGRVLARMMESSLTAYYTRWAERVIVSKYKTHEGTIRAALASEVAGLKLYVADMQTQLESHQTLAQRQREQAMEKQKVLQAEVYSAQATTKEAVVKMMQAHENVATTRDLAAQQLAAVEKDLHNQLNFITLQLHKAEAAMRTKLTRTSSEHAEQVSAHQSTIANLTASRDGMRFALQRARQHQRRRRQTVYLQLYWRHWRSFLRDRLRGRSVSTRSRKHNRLRLQRRSMCRWCSHVARSRQCELEWMRAQVAHHERGLCLANQQLYEKQQEIRSLRSQTSEMHLAQLDQIGVRAHQKDISATRAVETQMKRGVWVQWMACHRKWHKMQLALTEKMCGELQSVVLKQQARITELCLNN